MKPSAFILVPCNLCFLNRFVCPVHSCYHPVVFAKVVPTNRLEKLSVASLIKISNVFFFSFFLLGPKYFYISIATFTLANDLSRSFITDCKFKKIS